ncbi:MAG: threonine/serine exporter family protein [Lachnospiraceae bacterium]|nr:threonine/serine exporter family protein [Lachnospiraceae bacterium]
MNNLEYILDFILKLSEKMLISGANLERVNDTVYRICDSYGCEEAYFFSLNCYLTLSLKDTDGNRVTGQRCIREGMDTHLEKLSRLNQLSRRICAEKPEPEELGGLLEEAAQTKDYSLKMRLAGYLLAMACLTVLYDGSIKDLITILINTILIYLGGIYLKKPGVNRIVYSVSCTFVVGTLAILLTKIGLVDDIYTVMIVNSMMLIPGIPMVNAFRNLLCGNEINGMLEILKCLLESIAIVCGFVLSIFLFGGLIPW